MTVRRFAWIGFMVAVVVAMTAGYILMPASPASQRPSSRGDSAAPVVVARATTRAVPITLSAIGTAQPYATVAIKSRVDGQVLKAHFREGRIVKEGDLLFTIDPRIYQTQLRQAEANLARDRAQLDKARADLERSTELAKKGFQAQQQLEQAHANEAALAATIRGDEAAVDVARLQLEFTSIRSPITGQAGNLLINPGNLVKANDTSPLVVINQIRPIYVAFALPERHLGEILQRMQGGQIPVRVTVPSVDGVAAEGEVVFANNIVDSATGTIQLKATLPNADGYLVPGQFVDVVVTMSVLPDAIVVPSQAVQIGPEGTFVYVINADQAAEVRPVALGAAADGEVVIRKGLAAGETVVTEGQLRLAPGMKVVIRSEAGRSQASPRDGRPSGAERPEGDRPANGSPKA